MSEYQTPEWRPAFEQYCETIYGLDEDQVEVIQARIAERLDVSRPAVSEMVRRMAAEGLIEGGRTIALTAKGVALAEQVVRRHRLAERYLTEELGLTWAEAHEEAGKWEHVISASVENAMMERLNQPTTCPHGNPIPGTGYVAPELASLATLEPGSRFIVERIPESLEFADGMLEFLQTANVTPGQQGTVTSTSPDGAICVDVDGEAVAIGAFASERILIRSAS